MPDTPWWDFVQRISNHATPAQIARDAGLDKSAPSRWSNGGGIDAAQAVRVARAFNANVLEALAAAGFIESTEVDLVEVSRGLDAFSEVDLLRELLRRAEGQEFGGRVVALNPVGPSGDTGDVDELADAADVHNQTPDEDLRTP